MYDETLSQGVINMMYYAPLFFLGFGYWMASNKQILSNKNLFPVDRMTSPPQTHHTVDRVFTDDSQSDTPAWPLIWLFFLLGDQGRNIRDLAKVSEIDLNGFDVCNKCAAGATPIGKRHIGRAENGSVHNN